MKYLAILKDSLYEALDTKVFYVMVGLSSLVLMVVASMSYAPVTVEDDMERFARKLTWAMSFGGKNKGNPPTLEIADFKQTNPGKDPTQGNYQFFLVLRIPEDAENGNKPEVLSDAEKEREAKKLGRILQQQFPYLNDLTTRVAESPNPAEFRIEVTIHGTKVKRLEDWPHEPTIFFALPITIWHAPLGNFVHFWEDTIVNGFGAAIALLISSVITAFFIPNMLRKGTVDLLLVKPIHRVTLLIYKYIGGLAFMFLNTTFVAVGIWLILGVRTGLWGPGFLASILVLTFQFAFYYAVSTLVGAVTRSSIAAILMTCFAWFFFSFVIGNGYQLVDGTRKMSEIAKEMQGDDGDKHGPPPIQPFPDWVYTTADVIHFVTPRLKDLDALTTKLILDDTMPDFSNERKVADKVYANFRWSEALIVTIIYIVLLLGLSCLWFATKDY